MQKQNGGRTSPNTFSTSGSWRICSGRCSPEAIFSTLIAPRKDIGEEQKHVFLLWYMDLANLLRQEGKEEKGHLEHTLHLIQDLHDLHLQLMKLPVGAHYRQTNPSCRACGAFWATRG